MKAHQTNFAVGSVAQNIVDVALPITAAQFLNLLYSIVDRIYIGRIPDVGAMALTGVGLCFPIITLIAAFSALFGMSGGAPLCTIRMGEGNVKEAEKVMGTSFAMLLLIGGAITVLGLLFYKPILYLFGASDVTFFYGKEYVTIYLLGSVFVLVTLGMNAFINSQGFGRMGMMTVVVGALLNIILDPIFIFVLGMGVKGAAFATVISQFVSAIWVILFLTGKQAVLKISLKSMKIEWKRLKAIATLGLSGFVAAGTTSMVQIVCNKTASIYGGDLYVGILTILNSVREIFQTPMMGFANGAIPFISFNYGHRTFDRAKQGIQFLTYFTMGMGVFVWILLLAFPGFFIRLFNNDPQMLETGIIAIKIYFFGFCMMSLQNAGQCTFTALGKAKYATFFSIFRKVIIVIPLTLLLPKVGGFGVYGVFMAEPISNIVGGLACYITMRHKVFPELKEKKPVFHMT